MSSNNRLAQRKPIEISTLYLMHVDWRWAKQRPHFIAEHLASYFTVKVRFPLSYIKKLLNESAFPLNESAFPHGLDIGQIYRLPLSRIKLVSRLNELFMELQLARLARESDIVWVTHPSMYRYVKRYISDRVLLIYDCMDDALEFPDTKNDDVKRKDISDSEAALFHRSDIVFSSSSYLKHKLDQRYGLDTKIRVVNNGIQLKDGALPSTSASVCDISKPLANIADLGGSKVLYIGTVSEWFDFDIVIKSLEQSAELNYIIVGPCEVTPPVHDRLFIIPPVDHQHVSALMNWADALVMPFHLTELIKSVNPVKVYEYIYAQKPAIVLGYGETEAFSPYVYLYRTEEDFLSLMRLVASKSLAPKASADAARRFVEDSTWMARTLCMVSHIRAYRGAVCGMTSPACATDRRPRT